jgi:Holliday junction resolvase
MSNRQLGNSFESELCNILFDKGFWVHNLAQNQAGQPADVIAARNKVAYLIDCKVCSGKGFPLSRVEENQDSSMSLWKDCGNGEGWFAIKLAGIIYMIPHFTVMAFMKDKASMSPNDIFKCGKPLEQWIAKCK